MALVNIREVYPDVSLGLWRMEETNADFFANYPWLLKYRNCLESLYKSDVRRIEFLTVRTLLYEMLLLQGISERKILEMDIVHNGAGKPILQGYYISISHTRGYVALILSKKKEVAVDIEYYSNRVEHIASKFLREDERIQGLESMLVHWCAKETVYKLFSEDSLGFQEMRVTPFDVMADWSCGVTNLRTCEKVCVDFELTMEFVLTYVAK